MTEGGIIGFFIWLAVGLLFIGSGLACVKAKKPTGFWANAKTISIPPEQIKAYNHAMGKLWRAYGTIFIFLGIPLLLGNGLWIMLSCIGVMLESIGAMVFYTTKIETRYRKK